MSTIESLESLHEVLEPLGSFRSENEDLGGWIHDSFAALEKLHEELTQWQSELARKETELNLRTDALEKYPPIGTDVQEHITQLKEELVTIKEEAKQLEDENNEQLQEFVELERKYSTLKTELRTAHEQASQLEISLDFERQRSETDREHWKEEFRQLHAVLDKYNVRLLAQLELAMIRNEDSFAAEEDSATPQRSVAKSAELRERAQSRRKMKK